MNSVVETEVLNKPPLCIELVETNPLRAIAQVFDSIDFDYFRANVSRWFHAVITNQNHVYEEDYHQKNLQALFVDLELLLEAVYTINKNEQIRGSHESGGLEKVKKESAEHDKIYLLTQEQADNPHEMLSSFFNKFSMIYIRRELKDWLQAGIDIDESDKVKIKAIRVLLTYNDLECLLEAAYHYHKKTGKGQGKLLTRSLAMP